MDSVLGWVWGLFGLVWDIGCVQFGPQVQVKIFVPFGIQLGALFQGGWGCAEICSVGIWFCSRFCFRMVQGLLCFISTLMFRFSSGFDLCSVWFSLRFCSLEVLELPVALVRGLVSILFHVRLHVWF